MERRCEKVCLLTRLTKPDLQTFLLSYQLSERVCSLLLGELDEVLDHTSSLTRLSECI